MTSTTPTSTSSVETPTAVTFTTPTSNSSAESMQTNSSTCATPQHSTSETSILSTKKASCVQILIPSIKGQQGPSPAKMPKTSRNSLEDFNRNISAFHEDLNVKLKAVLYSVMVGDLQAARDDLDRLRRRSNAHFSQSAFALKDLQMKVAATNQKLQSCENYNLQLHLENNYLRDKITKMNVKLAMKEVDSSIYDDDFDDDDRQENDDDSVPKLQRKEKHGKGAPKGQEQDKKDKGVPEEEGKKKLGNSAAKDHHEEKHDNGAPVGQGEQKQDNGTPVAEGEENKSTGSQKKYDNCDKQ